MKDIIIIGAGIAGLSAALELEKRGIDYHLIDKNDRVGGAFETLKTKDYLVETGPHTFSSMSKEILNMVNELGIEEELIEANPNSHKRYIYNNGHLIPVPTSLKEFFKTELLTSDGKRTIFEELLINKEETEETIEDFFTRRFGRDVLRNLIQPYINGVYAGDVKKLSVNAVFPKLKELESKYKSVILGFLISKFSNGINFKREKITLYSFKEGLEFLPKEIYQRLKNKVTLNVDNLEVTRAKDCFIVSFKTNNKLLKYTTSSVLFATPAYVVKNFSHLFPNNYYSEIFHTEYVPIAVVNQLVESYRLNINLDGFGYLCAKEPHRKLLGTIWTSVVFRDRGPQDKILLTSYIGGTSFKKILDLGEEDIKNLVSKEVAEILYIPDHHAIETINVKVHPNAIPQYYIGHNEKVKRLEELITKNYGLFFTGNYLYGVSMNDTVKTSKKIVEKISQFLSLHRTKSTNEKIEVSVTNT